VDSLVEGELSIMKEDGSNDQRKTDYIKLESPTQKILYGYLASNVHCLECGHDSWVFDAYSDLIIGMTETVKQRRVLKSSSKRGYGFGFNIFSRSKSSSDEEMEDDDEEEERGGKLLKEFMNNHESGATSIPTKVADIEGGKVPQYEEKQDMIINIPLPRKTKFDSSSLSLENLLAYHFSTELLNNIDNHYRCEECRKSPSYGKSKAYIAKTLHLHIPPPCLAISLKRFKSSASHSSYFSSSSYSKNNNFVSYPLSLSLSSFALSTSSGNGELIYDLYAIMIHSGGMGGGHYVALAKHYGKEAQDCWVYVSDGSVRRVEPREVLAAQAYMLFYEKR